jgi:hypothetical protein
VGTPTGNGGGGDDAAAASAVPFSAPHHHHLAASANGDSGQGNGHSHSHHHPHHHATKALMDSDELLQQQQQQMVKGSSKGAEERSSLGLKDSVGTGFGTGTGNGSGKPPPHLLHSQSQQAPRRFSVGKLRLDPRVSSIVLESTAGAAAGVQSPESPGDSRAPSVSRLHTNNARTVPRRSSFAHVLATAAAGPSMRAKSFRALLVPVVAQEGDSSVSGGDSMNMELLYEYHGMLGVGAGRRQGDEESGRGPLGSGDGRDMPEPVEVELDAHDIEQRIQIQRQATARRKDMEQARREMQEERGGVRKALRGLQLAGARVRQAITPKEDSIG